MGGWTDGAILKDGFCYPVVNSVNAGADDVADVDSQRADKEAKID